MQNEVPDKPKVIEPPEISVDKNGVWLGFFTDGGSAVINVEELAGIYPPGSARRTTLNAWAADQRRRAAA